MTITQIEKNIQKLLKNFSQDNFVFEFLLAYGEPKATITRLKKGDLNQLESKGELTLRKKLFFKEARANLHEVIDTLRIESTTQKQKPRFIMVSDYETLLAYDTKTTDTLDIKFKDLAKYYDFFLPLAGMEKSTHVDENPADVKASNKLAKLYDEILKNNPTQTHEEVHALNVFLTRLLFCYFAEDSNIFDDNVFTNSISNHTQVDGSDMDSYLERLFNVFNADDKDREVDLPEYLKAFPYVNGGLFRNSFPLPKFTTKSRNILIDIGRLDWSEINPDIFGSMIQAVVTPEHRGDMGMHYTSVPNIMKVMQPLFLDEFYEEFEKSKSSKKKLQELINRISNLKIFDPACGSGNFLIIAYKELRKLEILILQEINTVFNMRQGELFGKPRPRQLSFLSLSSSIELTQFYGIELDDFAHEVAILSLRLTEHQMNIEFFKEFGQTSPSLPLKDGGNIVHGNATRIDWESVCTKENDDEIYIFGNPPYLGFKMQNKEQKEDMKRVFEKVKNYKKLDYISCWFYKGANYIKGINAKYAFVSTNSINQGEQVGLLWPNILKDDLEINFAYKSFKWQNNAKRNAGVTVVIIGLRNISSNTKFLYTDGVKQVVKDINAYLVNSYNIFIQKTSKPLSNLPKMQLGNMPKDDGNLILSDEEKNNLLFSNKECEPFIKKLMGAYEFLNGSQRWCFWIEEDTLQDALNIELIKNRIEKVKDFRLASTDRSANEMGKTPYKFREQHEAKNISIIIPTVTSERREYIPMGYLDKNSIVVAPNNVLYDPEPYIFGMLSSKMHILWVKAVGGRLETRVRYSSVLCYNTFPFPNISEKQKEEITELVFNILDEREQHSEKTLAQMYDPNKMPQDLKETHHQLDLAIEKCYRNKPFKNDEERLEYLFGLYEEMIAKEQNGKL
ncbi:MAG: SAM-dependent methyltransferase [Sulfurovum sp.]|nr:MAG: SAM-dependent methyltransferase [Sulfurovum sp.]